MFRLVENWASGLLCCWARLGKPTLAAMHGGFTVYDQVVSGLFEASGFREKRSLRK